MKKYISCIISVCFIFVLCLLTSSSAEIKDNNVNIIEYISIKNDRTGDIKILNDENIKVKKIKKEIKSLKKDSNIKTFNESYEIVIPSEYLIDNIGITPFTVDTGSRDEAGVKAVLTVDYDVNSTNEKIRLNKVYGSWTPKSSMYNISNRHVLAHSGTFTGKKLEKYPKSNSFSYTTNWGFNDRVFEYDLAPRAKSDAKITVTGMGGSHTINVDFVYGIDY